MPIANTPLRLFAKESVFGMWAHKAPAGTLLEHVLDPRYWEHTARRLQRFDEITVKAEDGSFSVVLEVLSVDPEKKSAVTAILRERRSKPMQASYPDKDGFTIEFVPERLWRIRLGDDLIADGFPDEATAVERLDVIKAAGKKKAA